MRQVQIDLVDMSGNPSTHNGQTFKYIFSALDVFSRFVYLSPITEKSAEAAANCFIEMCNLIGLPARLQSDQGSEFKGNYWPIVSDKT